MYGVHNCVLGLNESFRDGREVLFYLCIFDSWIYLKFYMTDV